MWIIFPILSAAAYAVSAFLKNYLADTAFSKKHAGAYLATQLLSYGMGILVLVAIMGRGVFMVPILSAVGLAAAGAVEVVGVGLYLKALKSGETMEVTIFGQSSPLVALALSAIFLGETITAMQGLAFILILGAAFILIFGNKSKKNGKLNLATVGLSFLSVIFWVVADIIFVKYAGDNVNNFQHFAQTFFFFELGAFLAVLIMVICSPAWRTALKAAFFGKKNAKNAVAMVVDNGFFTAGEFLFKLGLMAAPAVALMSVVGNASQLGITFVLGIVISRVFPRFAREKYNKRLVMQHLVAVLLAATGIVLLYF